MLEDKPASQGLSDFAESFEKVAKSAAAAALIFLIVFGCFYKWGEDRGRDAGQQIRREKGEPILQTLPSGQAVLFWKDDKIIQSGLYGFLTVAVLSTYVVLLFFFLKPPAEGRAEWVALRLRFPNVMSAAIVLALFMGSLRARFSPADATVLTLSIVFAACSWRWRSHLARQTMLLIGQVLLFSFLYGEQQGITASTDFERDHPLVDVLDTTGHHTTGLRLLKTDDSECRFVDSFGREQMIPKAQIRAISLDTGSLPRLN
jgi:hypothetical protein